MNNFKPIFNTVKSESVGHSNAVRSILLWLPVVFIRVLMLSVVMISVMTFVLTLIVKHTVNIIGNCIGSRFGTRFKKAGDKISTNAGSTVQYTELFFTRKDGDRLSTVSTSKVYASEINNM